MEYKQAVEEARRLVRRSEEDQWRLAQLTWEQLQVGATQRQWAEDVGVVFQTVSRWNAIWRYRIEHPDRFADGAQSYAQTEAIIRSAGEGESLRQAESIRTVRNLPPEQKAQVVREALAEPEVAERIVRDTPTRTRLAKAEHSVDREQQEVARERYELAEPRSVQIGAMADAEYGLTKIRTTAEDVSEAVDKLIAYDWPDNTKERVEVLVQRAAAAVELIKARVEGRDLDEELAALLEGGD